VKSEDGKCTNYKKLLHAHISHAAACEMCGKEDTRTW